ncbi:MAG: hypothetical protein PHU12_00455 [Candidatus Aenigmarchaeota archaeon]|nr:hypothetical protein [Candidatus Aenigmarchaeota archaeon]
MREVDGKAFIEHKLGLKLGLDSLGFPLPSGKSLAEVYRMQQVSGRLEPDGRRYTLHISKDKELIIEACHLHDPSWKVNWTNYEETQKKVMERYEGNNVDWYGMLDMEGEFIPFMAMVIKTDDTKDTKFYYNEVADVPSSVIENKFGIKLPIQQTRQAEKPSASS